MLLRNKLFITPTLATVIGTFVVITAAAILIIQALTSERVIRQLGGSLVDLGMDTSEAAFIEQLHAVTETANYTRASWESGELSFDDPEHLVGYIYGALAPQDRVSFMIMVDTAGMGVDVDRGDADGDILGGDVDLAADIPSLTPILEEAANRQEPFWSEPLYMPTRKHTYFIYTHPFYSQGTYRGSFLIGMSLERISDITWSISTDDITVFLMKEKSEEVVAHPMLDDHFEELSAEAPLLHVSQISDFFLSDFSTLQIVENKDYNIPDGMELRAGLDNDGNKRFIIIEHDMDVALRVSEAVTMMHNGRVFAEGTPKALINDQLVRQTYLGSLFRGDEFDEAFPPAATRSTRSPRRTSARTRCSSRRLRGCFTWEGCSLTYTTTNNKSTPRNNHASSVMRYSSEQLSNSNKTITQTTGQSHRARSRRTYILRLPRALRSHTCTLTIVVAAWGRTTSLQGK